jgi:hypothetical protein
VKSKELTGFLAEVASQPEGPILNCSYAAKMTVVGEIVGGREVVRSAWFRVLILSRCCPNPFCGLHFLVSEVDPDLRVKTVPLNQCGDVGEQRMVFADDALEAEPLLTGWPCSEALKLEWDGKALEFLLELFVSRGGVELGDPMPDFHSVSLLSYQSRCLTAAS